MSENTAENIVSVEEAFSEALRNKAYGKALQLLADMNSAEVAHLLESLPADERDLAWDLVRTKLEGDVLVHVNDNLRAELIRKMEPHELVAATTGLETDDLADLLPDMPDEVFNKVLRSMDEQNRTDTLMVVDREGRFMGVVPLTTLLTSPPEATIGEIMKRDVEAIPADMPAHEVAKLLAGLHEEEDLFAPVLPSTRRRALWLGINLMTAFLASWVIGLFDDTIQKLVALAVLMPIVASMGGIAGSQTMTLVIRGLALDQVGDHNARKLLVKEATVGLLNSLMWGLVIALVAWWWFNDTGLGAVIAAAMTINLLVAAAAGVLVPLLLRKLGADPALAGGVVLTTITDVVGFFSFLGLAERCFPGATAESNPSRAASGSRFFGRRDPAKSGAPGEKSRRLHWHDEEPGTTLLCP